jgi:hypothetical protein
VVILFQVGHGIQDFVVKTVAEAILLFVVPISLGEKLGPGAWRQNGRESRIVHDTSFRGLASAGDED